MEDKVKVRIEGNLMVDSLMKFKTEFNNLVHNNEYSFAGNIAKDEGSLFTLILKSDLNNIRQVNERLLESIKTMTAQAEQNDKAFIELSKLAQSSIDELNKCRADYAQVSRWLEEERIQNTTLKRDNRLLSQALKKRGENKIKKMFDNIGKWFAGLVGK